MIHYRVSQHFRNLGCTLTTNRKRKSGDADGGSEEIAAAAETAAAGVSEASSVVGQI
jgi:hypothetical protein